MYNELVEDITNFMGSCGIRCSVRHPKVTYFPRLKENAFMVLNHNDGRITWGIIKEKIFRDGKTYIKLYEEGQVNKNTYKGIIFYWIDNYWSE